MIKFPLGKGKEKNKSERLARQAERKKKKTKQTKIFIAPKNGAERKKLMSSVISANKTYHIMNARATTRRLNLYSSGTAANGMNVVLYTNDNTNEQKWYFDGDRLYPETNRNYCLDRYTASTYLNNADIWKASASDAAAQLVDVVKAGDYYNIRLRTKVNGEYYYLTAVGDANGSGSGKSTASKGNVYWAPSLGSSSLVQKWMFTEVDGPSSGGETGGDGDTYTINGKTIPLSEWPVGSYWTTGGKPYEYGKNSSKAFTDGAIQCAGFAKYVYEQLWGNYKYGQKVAAVTLEGTSEDFKGINVGARINCDRRGSKIESEDDFTTSIGNHSMILLSKTSSGIVVYECNHDDKCGIGMRTITYRNFYLEYMNIKNSSYTP